MLGESSLSVIEATVTHIVVQTPPELAKAHSPDSKVKTHAWLSLLWRALRP